MKPLTAREMAVLLTARGWPLVCKSGSHMVFRSTATGQVVVVPYHAARTLSTGTQRRIMRDAKIGHDEI